MGREATVAAYGTTDHFEVVQDGRSIAVFKSALDWGGEPGKLKTLQPATDAAKDEALRRAHEYAAFLNAA
jgi:hypothetical protein